MSVKDTGIRWVNGDRLGDLNFADDIALLENSWKGMKELTDRTQKEAAEFGLRAHCFVLPTKDTRNFIPRL